jgi:hypothetical protein
MVEGAFQQLRQYGNYINTHVLKNQKVKVKVKNKNARLGKGLYG